MIPAYDREGVTIYHGDAGELIPEIAPETVGLVLSDPPYGNALAFNYKSDRGRKKDQGTSVRFDYHPIEKNEEDFDPRPMLRFPRVMLFGGNYFASKLPDTTSWIVWNKVDGMSTDKRYIGFTDQADVELIWSNVGGPARIIPHRWCGYNRASEKHDHFHPTQKPVLMLMALLLEYTKPGDLVADFYLGSASTAVACIRTGRRFVGCELSAHYCLKVAIPRVSMEQDNPQMFDHSEVSVAPVRMSMFDD